MTVSKAIPQELITGLLADYKKTEDLIGENGRLKQLTKHQEPNFRLRDDAHRSDERL